MNLATAVLTTLALLVSSSTEAQTPVITRGGSRPVRPGPAENFTGGVQVEMLFEALDPAHASGGSVTFEPGARTAWHSHPRGQILIVTAGIGRVRLWGGPIEEIRAGDVVRIPPGQKHWHGASPQTSMTHLAVTEHRDGTVVQWMEKVSDEQYDEGPANREGRAPAPAQAAGPSDPPPRGSTQRAAPSRRHNRRLRPALRR
jgi:quercetin dioxygenase-like cupin family protein